jgi:hypothetical protein
VRIVNNVTARLEMTQGGKFTVYNYSMVEIRMWKWQYTDADGKRRVSRWLMTEKEAMRYQDAIRLQHTLRVLYDKEMKGLKAISRGQTPILPPIAPRHSAQRG